MLHKNSLFLSKYKSTMINYQQKKYWKIVIFVFAILISLSTLIYTNILVNSLSKEQYKMISLFADAYKQLNNLTAEEKCQDISFLFKIIKSNENIPIILTDTNGNILEQRNLDEKRSENKEYLLKQLDIMKKQHNVIEINYSPNNKNLIYYKDSKLITQLKIYPFIQLFLVILFIFIAYFAFSSSWKYEQNKVWTGMSRETAHQLGTPVSSLLALSENFKMRQDESQKEIIKELDNDIFRLEKITSRFSKIGTVPKPELKNIHDEIESSLEYLIPRISKQVIIKFNENSNKNAKALVISSLFDWVLENLCKNSINAMEGIGTITFDIQEEAKNVVIDISDDGKGISRLKYKTIFKAGYTTRKRGWGLGLSLSKRIIELYHKGQIFVKSSEIKQGTTIRIKLLK